MYLIKGLYQTYVIELQWKLDLAYTDLAENLGLKDILQEIWATVSEFWYISLLEIAENLDLADKSLVTDFKSSFHCNINCACDFKGLILMPNCHR